MIRQRAYTSLRVFSSLSALCLILLVVGGLVPVAEGQQESYTDSDDAPMFVATAESAALLEAGRHQILQFRFG